MAMAGTSVPLIERVPMGARDPDAVLERFLAWLEDRGIEPYAAQEEAFLEVLAGHHVLLGTPTGSGKTLVAALLHFKAMSERSRSFYTCPTKALASEKFFWLCDEFGPENVGMLTGDASINPEAPILCATTEILAQMALRRGPDTPAPYVVMDEFHFYADRARGTAWQIPLLVLSRTQFLLMSATFGDPSGIARHLRARTGRAVRAVFSDERPVPLDFAYRETSLHETVESLLSENKAPIYIVHFTQREAAEQAQALTSAKLASREERERIRHEIADFRFDTAYGKELRRFLGFGIGVHHAGLLPRHRLLVEQLSQRGLLKVICGTDTLGVGVNIPIRTVVFAKLCKYDGEKLGLLRAREFRQIAGRAGRRGFDEQGSVVCQAPEHVIERRRAERGAGGKRPRRQAPASRRREVSWNEATFERLIHQADDPLRSAFRLTHGVLVGILQRDSADAQAAGYAAVIDLIDRSHETSVRKHRLRREAARLFRSLRRAGIVEVVRDSAPRCSRGGRRRVRVGRDLQSGFSLHHALSLYLVDAVAALDRDDPDYALDVLSTVEAILEDPLAILLQQQRALKTALLNQLKADRVPYEERIRRLDEVTHPRPCAAFLEATFAIFAERHPWVGHEQIRPKSIAREMYESYSSFAEYVARYGIARIEGTLLRYLGEAYRALAQNVPDHAKTEGVREIEAYLRALVERVDRSLFEEWESLRFPGASAAAPDPAAACRTPALEPAAFRARVRTELHTLVRALSRRDYEEAAACVQQPEADAWPPERFARALAPFYEEHDEIVFTPRARLAEWTRIDARGPMRCDAVQVLLDPAGDHFWCVEAEVDRSDPEAEGPWLRLKRIGT